MTFITFSFNISEATTTRKLSIMACTTCFLNNYKTSVKSSGLYWLHKSPRQGATVLPYVAYCGRIIQRSSKGFVLYFWRIWYLICSKKHWNLPSFKSQIQKNNFTFETEGQNLSQNTKYKWFLNHAKINRKKNKQYNSCVNHFISHC